MTNMTTASESADPQNPADIWRILCSVTPWLYVSGDLATELGPDAALAQLKNWQEAGITHIIDLRGEWQDIEFVARHAPEIDYRWLGTHDDGGAQSDTWWDAGLAAAERARDSGGRVVVHCHMGVNRAPSLAYRILLAEGVGPIEAFDRIRAARPIAAVLYAPSALDHHHRTIGTPEDERIESILQLREHMFATDVDTMWVISRIREAGG
jgi:hypothetical protein